MDLIYDILFVILVVIIIGKDVFKIVEKQCYTGMDEIMGEIAHMTAYWAVIFFCMKNLFSEFRGDVIGRLCRQRKDCC